MDKYDYITSIHEAHDNLSPSAFKKAIAALGYNIEIAEESITTNIDPQVYAVDITEGIK
jgi:hypothetical protein